MKTLGILITGRGACPHVRRAVGGNGPYLIATLLLTTSLAFAAEPAATASCCKPEPAPKKDVCCAAMEIAPFSPDSIYQLDGSFIDDSGRPFALGQLRGRPVVLNMFFTSCGYACPLTVTDMQSIREKLPATVRERAVFVLVSFDVARDTTDTLAKYRVQRALDSQWILLRGTDDSVRELAALLGVKSKQETDGMFSHSNLVTILNSAGEIVHQRTGLKGGLDEAAAALLAADRTE